jgi:hypothetical protein
MVELMSISPEQFREHLKRAAAMVATWPAWKQNILKHSGEPMSETPREPVDNFSEFDPPDAAMIKPDWHRKQHEAREAGELRLKLVGPINAAIGDLLIAAADFDEEATDTAERLYRAAKDCGIDVSGYDEQITKAVEKLHSLGE